MTIKVGHRLRSQVDETEVIVVRVDDHIRELTCGGHPMAELDAAGDRLSPVVGATDGNQLGKRYTAEGSKLEVLVTKAGQGTLSADGVALVIKSAKPLPASD